MAINKPGTVIHRSEMFTLFSRWKTAVNLELWEKGETGSLWEHKITCWTVKLKQENSPPNSPLENSLHSPLKKTKRVCKRSIKSYTFVHNFYCTLEVWFHIAHSSKRVWFKKEISSTTSCFSFSSMFLVFFFIPRHVAMSTNISYVFPQLINVTLTHVCQFKAFLKPVH